MMVESRGGSTEDRMSTVPPITCEISEPGHAERGYCVPLMRNALASLLKEKASFGQEFGGTSRNAEERELTEETTKPNVSKTLLVRHLPAEMSKDEKEDMLKYFGAEFVRVFPSRGRMKNVAFATFRTENIAAKALSRLHQLQILGHTLVVEFAKGEDSAVELKDPPLTKNSDKTTSEQKKEPKQQTIRFLEDDIATNLGMRSWPSYASCAPENRLCQERGSSEESEYESEDDEAKESSVHIPSQYPPPLMVESRGGSAEDRMSTVPPITCEISEPGHAERGYCVPLMRNALASLLKEKASFGQEFGGTSRNAEERELVRGEDANVYKCLQ
ncbi:hypothetical protein WMY93_030049 [Mugilogobius chulae]|uniref:RNA-binding region-containing protein 3 n=1 Tax=Mugilogobius chulae TaxID=88201 RepID=A0AAW0MML8_9GOBI